MKKALSLLLVLLVSCARQVMPGGGPDDKTPPAIDRTRPALGAIKIPVHSSISFVFSKWIDKRTAEKSVSIFPPPAKGITIKVSGRTMVIKPVPAFAESTTYHIELNNSLFDLHGNSIGTPFHFFFSTGQSIDSGKITGCVVSSEKKLSQPKVALFGRMPGAFPDSLFFGLPSYVVQTDSAGLFRFDHIRKGTYELIAFNDANNDNRLEPPAEEVFAPLEKSLRLDSIIGPLPLYPITCDTSTNRVLLLKPVSAMLLMGTWSRIPDTLPFKTPPGWSIETLEKKSAGPGIMEYIPIAYSSRFYLRLTDTMSLASYRLVYPLQPRILRGIARRDDTVRFNGLRDNDTVRPAVLGFSPEGIADLKPRIRLVWSKPVFATAATWTMADSLGDTAKLSIAKGLADSTIFQLNRRLRPGRHYRLQLSASLFHDINGIHPHDSGFGAYTLQTTAPDNLCSSINGFAPCLKRNPRGIWQYLPINASGTYKAEDRTGRFLFDSIPSGKGRMAYFIDYNNDDQPTPGSLIPWQKPEPYHIFADTIEARARWDVEGIELHGCEACAKTDSLAAPKTEKEPRPPEIGPTSPKSR